MAASTSNARNKLISGMQRAVAQAQEAERQAAAAKSLVRTAKADLKGARKSAKAARKRAKRARKKVAATAAMLEKHEAAASNTGETATHPAGDGNPSFARAGRRQPPPKSTTGRKRTASAKKASHNGGPTAGEVARSVIKRLAVTASTNRTDAPGDIRVPQGPLAVRDEGGSADHRAREKSGDQDHQEQQRQEPDQLA
ncbi:MAG: hypothetical protein NVSMB10_02180 [Steroidobacteraceae bacterium]